MEQELRTNEKEQAEHIMLVDLLRNDLGRIADYGSVRASELFTIERYSHVMHLVSEVEARLAPDKTVYDVIAAVFPGGRSPGLPRCGRWRLSKSSSRSPAVLTLEPWDGLTITGIWN
ncbi:hypothetical protein HMSSN036_61080 [Paenibacillus macerans]|nr:hypothetical protein HMSSN036_61080 [Paenibacillus macerans]